MSIGLYDQALQLRAQKTARVRLANQLRAYYEVMVGEKVTAGDVENLTLQALDMAEEVLSAYPPLKEVDALPH